MDQIFPSQGGHLPASRLAAPEGQTLQPAGEMMVPVPMAELFTIAAQFERSGKMAGTVRAGLLSPGR